MHGRAPCCHKAAGFANTRYARHDVRGGSAERGEPVSWSTAPPPEDEARSTYMGSGGRGGAPPRPPTRRLFPEGEPDRFARILTRLRDTLSRNVANAVPFASALSALDSADTRRQALVLALRSAEPFSEGPEGPFVLFSELDSERPLLREQSVLAWQLQAPELLLLGRAGEAVLAMLDAEADTQGVDLNTVVREIQPVVSIRPLPWLLARTRPSLFPWRVVVTTRAPEFMRARFESLSDWIGVGVDVAQGGTVQDLARCEAPGGLDGTVAGSLETRDGARVQLTCGHVVGPMCPAALWHLPAHQLANTIDEPDAAVLLPHGCFGDPAANSDEVQAATYDQVVAMLRARSLLTRVGGGARSADGELLAANLKDAATSLVTTGDGGVSTFPALTITARRRRFRRRRPFSQSGDSGSWVVNTESRLWLGMIDKGQENVSFAIYADALVNHLARKLPDPYDTQETRCWTSLP